MKSAAVRKPVKRARAAAGTTTLPEFSKPKLPPLDPAIAIAEAEEHAREGNAKLARLVDLLREGLQLIVYAEYDHSTKPPTPMSPAMIRALAAETLDAMSQVTGQNWRLARNQVVRTRAGRADNQLGKNVGNDGADYD